ncbi:MAG: TetR/AcrR family transcriptional regulator [Rhodanobacteraceae bacterium]|nr:MAG: TetR/AcrR family transcriptional regulator [Rhodanobacteraceae bacterium]
MEKCVNLSVASHRAQESNRRLAARTAHLLPETEGHGTQGRVLKVALTMFAERGYAATSVRDIAAAVGVKGATIYAHYASKEHILAELCRIGHDAHYRGLRTAVLGTSGRPVDQLIAYVQAHVGFHTTYPMLAVVANSELHALSKELGASTFLLRRQSVELLREIVERGVHDHTFHVPDVWLAVAAIGGMGLRVAYWFSADHALSAAQVADGYTEFALRLVGTPPRRGTAQAADPEADSVAQRRPRRQQKHEFPDR